MNDTTFRLNIHRHQFPLPANDSGLVGIRSLPTLDFHTIAAVADSGLRVSHERMKAVRSAGEVGEHEDGHHFGCRATT